ncbi:MAG: tRNA pseudouridine(55) synthase TruB [Synergistaceae bacterium]|nr:tRNA pseudouridine(55) synthase TruB [Synergistota bacterium]NLM72272.1 tRNA pseudouridine(55) synthase TruB [Synergistaceae bacterium]
MHSGLLLLNKPTGVRSAVCCAMVKRRLKNRFKVGHGGTLDSTAEGLLPILVGAATRTSDLVMSLVKEYEATMALGEERSTDDYSGEVLFSGEMPQDAAGLVRLLLPSFYGLRMQTPPSVSAVKVKGRRAHRLARSGESFQLRERPVYIRSISLIAPAGSDGDLRLRIVCGKGTYIRSIVRDIGRMVGCGAHTIALTRKRVGDLTLDRAIPFELLQDDGADIIPHIMPLSRLAKNFHRYEAAQDATSLLRSGIPVRLSMLGPPRAGDFVAGNGTIVMGDGLFCYGTISADGHFVPSVNILLGGKP